MSGEFDVAEHDKNPARYWAERELERDTDGNRIPRLADCDWPKRHLREALDTIDSLRSALSSTREKYEQAVRERDAANAAFDELSREVRLATLINPENPPTLATYIRERYARERDQWKANHDQRLRERDELRAENSKLMSLINGAAEVVAASTVIRRRHADVFTNLQPGSDTDNWIRAIDKFHADDTTTRSGK